MKIVLDDHSKIFKFVKMSLTELEALGTYLKIKESLDDPSKMKNIGSVAIQECDKDESYVTYHGKSESNIEQQSKRRKTNRNFWGSSKLREILANMARERKICSQFKHIRGNDDVGRGALDGMILVNSKPIESYSIQGLLNLSSISSNGDLIHNAFEISPKNVEVAFGTSKGRNFRRDVFITNTLL